LIPLNVNRIPRECGNSVRYVYEHDPNVCLAMNDQRCILSEGKGLGGQGITGDMIYGRGNRQDYDNWCQKDNEGWCFKDVLPFYLRMENTTFPCAKGEYCGSGGPVTVSYANYRNDLADFFMQAGEELGYRRVNYNQKYMTGFSLAQTTLKDGLRQNSYDAYIKPVLKERPNLTVRTNAKVFKLIISKKDGENYKPRVTGVVYKSFGFTSTVMVSREVVLTSSPIGTAQILMLSGIGPAQHLDSLGIDVVSDLQVGFNFHDVIGVGGLTFLSSIPVNDLESIFTPEALDKFQKTRTGPASSPNIEAFAFLESSRNVRNYPDIEVALRAGSLISQPIVFQAYNGNETILKQHFSDILDKRKNAFSLFVSVLRPKSRGRVMLRSVNPDDAPIVRGNFYSDPYDIKVAVKAIKLALKVMETDSFKKINATFYDKPLQPCAHHEYGDKKYWKCYARHFTFPLERWAGTTKMGPQCDSSAVVDSKLRVHGIENLRVSGPAIQPQQVTGHADSVKTLIAEKLAHMICKYQKSVDKRSESYVKKQEEEED
jgi:choline dehydrogenase-like flavoprotein